MRRSEGEQQGGRPEEGKKRSKQRRSRRREGAGTAGAMGAAMITWCGSFDITGCSKYLSFESRVCCKKQKKSTKQNHGEWFGGMIRGASTSVPFKSLNPLKKYARTHTQVYIYIYMRVCVEKTYIYIYFI